MKFLSGVCVFCLITTGVLSQSVVARDYSYMDDHVAEETAGSGPATPTVQEGSLLDSAINAAVTTGIDSVEESVNKDQDSVSKRFYKNFKNERDKYNRNERNRYEQDKYDREYRDRYDQDKNDREYRKRYEQGKKKGWNEEKWSKERAKHHSKAQKKKNKQWKKEQKKREKEKRKYFKEQKQDSEREWRDDEYERRGEWEDERREYYRERNEAHSDYTREREQQRSNERGTDYEARERARKRYKTMQEELDSL